MPWKIFNAELEGRTPCLHMRDESVDLHMVTDLGNGVIDLYIGSPEPERSAIYVTIDVDRKDGIVQLEHAVDRQGKVPFNKQHIIIDSVLMTMGIPDRTRQTILYDVRRVAQGRIEAYNR